MKKKRSFFASAITFTDEEIQTEKLKAKLRAKLGIKTIYDDTQCKQYSYIPSMYSSIEEYERDKDKADYLITIDKPIPNELYDKLVQARLELESKGLLKKFD